MIATWYSHQDLLYDPQLHVSFQLLLDHLLPVQWWEIRMGLWMAFGSMWIFIEGPDMVAKGAHDILKLAS